MANLSGTDHYEQHVRVPGECRESEPIIDGDYNPGCEPMWVDE